MTEATHVSEAALKKVYLRKVSLKKVCRKRHFEKGILTKVSLKNTLMKIENGVLKKASLQNVFQNKALKAVEHMC